MRTRNMLLAAAASMLVLNALPAIAANPSDQAKSAPLQTSAKPMATNEPMAGGMKKDGMMKEDVGKAEKKWSKEMDEKLKQEKMK